MPFSRFASLAFASLAILVSTGCSTNFGAGSSVTQKNSLGAIRGVIHGGQQAIAGAHIYVFAVGTDGYGSQSTSLLQAGADTTADTTTFPGQTVYYVTSGPTEGGGAFSVTGDYTCTQGSQVYLYASGGSSDGGTDINDGIGMLAGLGQCPASGTLAALVPYVTINEVSTIATAYALAGFATDATHISSDAGVTGNTTAALATTGAANAMANVPNILDIPSGTALTATSASGSSGTVPYATINTLANILASCINTPTSASDNCTTLFRNATSDGVACTSSCGNQPTDTATAAINIAHHPVANVATLYGLQPGIGAPFANALTTTPDNFLLEITFTGGGLNWPWGMAADANGNIWVANNGKGVSEFAPSGAALSGPAGYTSGTGNPFALAIDLDGNAWAVNWYGSNNITKIGTDGTVIDNYSAPNMTHPSGIAVDASNNVWVSNTASQNVSEFSSDGTVLSGNGYASGLGSPISVAIDTSGNVWNGNENDNFATELSSTGAVLSGAGYTGGGIAYPGAAAVDASGSIWFSNIGTNSLSKLSSTGVALSGSSGYTGGGLNHGDGSGTNITIDGDGNAWVGNMWSSASEFSNAGVPLSPASGYTLGINSYPRGSTIDGSGNVWLGEYPEVNNTYYIMELMGAAAPVVTPLVNGVKYHKLGTRP